jgi:CP family cyanate transporter-like MFS transporter
VNNFSASRSLALFAIALLAINLRTAVSSLSPIVGFIQAEISLPIIAIGLLGIASPLAFAISSSISYKPAKKFGVEATLVLTVVAIVLGHLLRAFAFDTFVLFIGSMLSLLGMGIGNVLLPVLVRKYFADKIGPVSAFYLTLTALSASIGSLFAVPLADQFGWRFSLGQWSILAALSLLPLIPLLKNNQPATESEQRVKLKLWRSPTALAIATVQVMTSVFGYVSFAWLPLLLIEHLGQSPANAGSLLALFAIMGLVPSLVVPVIAARSASSHSLIVYFSSAMGTAGSLGLLFSNQTTWLWVMLLGLGPTMFPLALTLFNLRSRRQETVLAVSSFGQGVSYTTASVAVIVVGILRELSGGWELTLLMLAIIAMLSSLAGLQLQKKRFVEDELTD